MYLTYIMTDCCNFTIISSMSFPSGLERAVPWNMFLSFVTATCWYDIFIFPRTPWSGYGGEADESENKTENPSANTEYWWDIMWITLFFRFSTYYLPQQSRGICWLAFLSDEFSLLYVASIHHGTKVFLALIKTGKCGAMAWHSPQHEWWSVNNP